MLVVLSGSAATCCMRECSPAGQRSAAGQIRSDRSLGNKIPPLSGRPAGLASIIRQLVDGPNKWSAPLQTGIGLSRGDTPELAQSSLCLWNLLCNRCPAISFEACRWPLSTGFEEVRSRPARKPGQRTPVGSEFNPSWQPAREFCRRRRCRRRRIYVSLADRRRPVVFLLRRTSCAGYRATTEPSTIVG